jgi:hypothetical protein
MRFQTAVAVSKETQQDVLVMAASWFKNIDPTFVTRAMTLPYMGENLPSIVVVHGSELVPAVNAACNRTVEKLLIKKLITPNNPPEIELLLKPVLSKNLYILPHVKTKRHWLLNAAIRGLQAWIEGERP